MITVTRQVPLEDNCCACGGKNLPGIELRVTIPLGAITSVTRYCMDCAEKLTIKVGLITLPELFDGWLEPL